MLLDEGTCVSIEYKQGKVMRTALFWGIITQRNNPEERSVQLLRGGSLKSRNEGVCFAARFY
jgi:hypothetical protein